MIVVDEEKCIGCGSCVDICHEHCIRLTNETISINHELCSTCTQCIAVCPEQALSWDGVPSVAYDEARLPGPDQLDELFKERRSIRFFKEDKLDRALLEEIVGYGIYAPTNNYDLRAVVVDDEELIEVLDQTILRFVSKLYRFIFKPKIVFNLIRRITPTLQRTDKVKMESTLERGHAFHRPPAVVFIVGDPRIGLSEASAHYALYNMILYAQAKGVGSCLWGSAQMFLDRNRAVRKRLGLRKHERILGALGLGYPAGIVDAQLSPSGYGLYCDNVFLKGRLVWSKGKLDEDGLYLDIDEASPEAWIKLGGEASYIRGRSGGGIDIISTQDWVALKATNVGTNTHARVNLYGGGAGKAQLMYWAQTAGGGNNAFAQLLFQDYQTELASVAAGYKVVTMFARNGAAGEYEWLKKVSGNSHLCKLNN